MHSDDGRVLSFLEKPRPEEIDTNLINAGMYVLEPDVLDLIPPGRPVSIEREVFPQLVEEQAVYGVALAGYWLDIGTPDAYLQAHRDVLERNFVTELGDALGARLHARRRRGRDEPGARLVPPVFVGAGATIGAGARIGSLAVIGADAVIGEGASVESSVIGAGAVVGPRTHVSGSIVGEQAELGAECEVRGLSVSGLAPRSATGICSTTGCGSRRTRRSRRAQCRSRERSTPRTSTRSTAGPSTCARSRSRGATS